MATRLGYDAVHAIAYPSKTLAANGGAHIYNVELSADCDNGAIVKRGAFIDLDLYEEAEASTMTGVIQKQAANGNWYVEITANPDHELFVYTPAFIAEEWTKTMKNEKRWFNLAGETVRGYDLAVGDVVELSVEGFDGTPEAGKDVTVAGKKFVVA